MWVLLFDLHNAHLGLELLKVVLPQWLGEHIRELLLGPNLLEDDLPLLHIVPNEMEPDINVLAAAVEDRVFCQLNG